DENNILEPDVATMVVVAIGVVVVVVLVVVVAYEDDFSPFLPIEIFSPFECIEVLFQFLDQAALENLHNFK
uniref:hypothetical protein n=1 Tax=Proteus mirabilis TaxID=584 RepID=UPI0015C521E9